ncbi:hypothetical protein MesoLjLc_49380 [Mesorhizobium sp. L-8-10]|nr:hypothetical protein MesoLjLc_49380 [Mesorhizobium sp. L-8-10]
MGWSVSEDGLARIDEALAAVGIADVAFRNIGEFRRPTATRQPGADAGAGTIEPCSRGIGHVIVDGVVDERRMVMMSAAVTESAIRRRSEAAAVPAA